MAGLGLAAATTVALVMAGSVTLLPAAIGLLGDRVGTTRVRGVAASALIGVTLLAFGTGFRLLLVAIPLAVVVLVDRVVQNLRPTR